MRTKVYFTLCLSIVFSLAFAQSYRNEWIDYSKSYYKFKLGPFGYDIVGSPIKNGIVRVSQAVLAAAGLGSTPAQNLQLWRNGQEVPLFVSNGAGVMSSSDYIEFWGDINDGAIDKDLYKSDTLQLSGYWSIQSDTAAYFFTVNTSSSNKRFTTVNNNAGNSSLQPDENFMYTVGRYYRSQVSGGYFPLVSGEAFYSCAYDKGEGYTSRNVTPANAIPQNFPTLYADVSGPAMTAQINAAGNANNFRSVKVLLNNDSIGIFTMNYFDDAKEKIANIPASKITGDAANFYIQDICPATDDIIRISKIELTYPRLFNFGNAANFRFTLAPSANGRLISITNFDKGASVPLLYDLSNGKRYVADVSVANTFRFLVEPSALPYNLAMVRGDGSAAINITSLQPKKFVNYAEVSNQGNYLIISNPLIYGSGSTNYVEQYRAYRSSPDGGNFNAKVIDIEELTDQFAYGIQKHPLSIKNFLRFARNNFPTVPAYVFLVGKGVVYSSYNKGASTKLYADQLNLVPTWGSPGSDNFLASENTINPIPLIPIGRLSAVTAQEVGDYLDKVKHYEALQKTAANLPLAERSYMKNVIQIAGANDPTIGPLLASYTNNYTKVIADTSFGATVNNFIESNDPAGYPQAVVNFKSVYESGSSLVEYFGHSSATSLDFGLDNPDAYNTAGKYPMFIVNGCLAGNIFDYDANRFNLRTSISEKFVLEAGKGAVGYISTSSWGIADYLNVYTQKMYESISRTEYGKGFGNITAAALSNGLNSVGEGDYFARYHAEEYAYHGDPAITLNSFSRPDYALDTSLMQIEPGYISAADDSFTIKIKMYNLGKATNDSVHLSVYRKFENGDSTVVLSTFISSLKGLDSLTLSLPIVANRDTSVEYISAFINDAFAIDELNKDNNYAVVPVHIYQADIRPVYPYNYSIVTSPLVTLAASTANPLAAEQQYIMEMDTTALFNSPLKTSSTVTSTGGVIEYKNRSLTQQAVYYWRVSQAGTQHWNLFSFLYNPAGSNGFEQSHYFQHTASAFTQMNLDSARRFNFDSAVANVFVQQGIYPYSALEPMQQSIMVNGQVSSSSACIGHSIIFNTFDSLTFKAQPNLTNPFGAAATCDSSRKNNFEYYSIYAADRDKAFQFLNSLPDGTWVIAKRNYDIGDADWATVWAKDSLTYHNGTLYQSFKNLGLPIDSFYKPRTFVFLFRKGDTTGFKPLSYFSQGVYDRVTFSVNVPVKDTAGFITSPKFGPATAWNSIQWNGFFTENNDLRNVSVYGVNTAGNETLLYTLDSSQHSFNLSAIDPLLYPFAKLKLKTQDSLLANPYQLQQWQVTYQPVAEGAIAPGLGMQIKDTFYFKHDVNTAYDTLAGFVVFKNVSIYNFKPLKLSLQLTDEKGNIFNYTLPVAKALPAGDTLHAAFSIDARALPRGLYNLQLQVNPDNDQPEQYLFNNTIYKYIYLSRGTVLPVVVISFAAQPENEEVRISWTVASETGTAGYEVEHSTDGVRFVTIGMVKAAGKTVYTLQDASPAAGKNYYRLKIKEANGAYMYSDIRLVTIFKILSVLPNPFGNAIKILTGTVQPAAYSVTIYSAAGQQLLSRTYSGDATINTTAFAAGAYIIKIKNGATVQTFTLQKQQ